MIVTQHLGLTASKNQSGQALFYLAKPTSYNDLRTRIGRLSYLYQREIGHGHRIAFLARNAPAVVTTFFAMTNTRNLSVFIDPDQAPDDIIEQLKGAKATHLFVTSDLLGQAREYNSHGRLNLPIVEIEKKQGGEYDTSYTPPPDQVPADTDPILLVKTGGHSGKPKWIPINHKQLLHAAICLRGSYHLKPTDRVLTQLNWAHPFALLHGMLMPVLNGSTCLIDHGLGAKDFLDFITESRASRIVATPPLLLKMLVTIKNEKQLIPSVRSVTSGLGTLSPEARKIFGMLKIGVAQTYGKAEACWTIALEDPEQEAPVDHRHYVGKPLPGFKYKVVDPQGDEIEGPDTREGLLAVSGPSVMTAYEDLEKETKSAIRGTWLYTGDYARLEGENDDLKIHLLGRKEELLLEPGGAIIVADGPDHAARTVPGVQDAAGFAVQNTKGKDVLACAVVKIQGSGVTEKQVLDHCREKLGDRAPLVVVFTDSIPRDSGGVVNRTKLRNQFSGCAG
jgi:acyl-CoA synthetase (AMP-forming)/AMP-acid ligase II